MCAKTRGETTTMNLFFSESPTRELKKKKEVKRKKKKTTSFYFNSCRNECSSEPSVDKYWSNRYDRFPSARPSERNERSLSSVDVRVSQKWGTGTLTRLVGCADNETSIAVELRTRDQGSNSSWARSLLSCTNTFAEGINTSNLPADNGLNSIPDWVSTSLRKNMKFKFWIRQRGNQSAIFFKHFTPGMTGVPPVRKGLQRVKEREKIGYIWELGKG